MPTNILPTSDAARQVWSAERIEKVSYDNVIRSLIGTSPKSPVQEITGLKGKGKGITQNGIYIFNTEPTPGSSGFDADEENKEQSLTPSLDSLTLQFYTKGIDVGYVSQEQYNITQLRSAAEAMTEDWINHWIEGGYTGYTGLIDLLQASPNATFWGGTGNAAKTDLAAGDTLSVDDLTNIEASLLAGENIAGTAITKFNTADFLGYTDSFVMIANPLVYAGLKRSSDWKTIQANAQQRGKTDEYWNRMVDKYVVAKVGKMVLMQTDRMAIEASTVRIGGALILGSQAGLYGQGMSMPTVEGTNRSKTKVYVYPKMIMGIKATTLATAQHNTGIGYYAIAAA